MKTFKKISQNQLIGLLTLLFVVLLGVGLYLAYSPVDTTEDEFDPNETPPLVQIDAGYNATLSGEPFYVVDDRDEDFDDNLDVCDEFGTNSDRRGVQNGWYQVVAYEDNMTVEEVIFEQIDLREGDKMVAVIYNAEDQEWMAWPNKIIVDENGNNVELLDRDEDLEKGTVVAVSADRDTDYCVDYEEIGDHENIELKWNLVSRPDFDKVDYRTIWEVAFAKGGNSGVDLERYYSASDPSNSVAPNQLPEDQLYWVYGGTASVVTGGGDPEEPEDEQAIVVKVNNSIDGSNTAGQRDVVNGETFQINEDGGEVIYSVGLALPAEGDVELEFEIYEDGQLVAVTAAEEIASRSPASGAGSFARGKNFSDGENTQTAFNLEAIDDDLAEIPKSVEFKVVDKAGGLDEVSFNVDIVDDDSDVEVETTDLEVTVLDALTDDKIVGANVLIEGESTGSVTDLDGVVSLQDVAESGKVVVSFNGYESQTVEVSTAVDGKLTVRLIANGGGPVCTQELRYGVALKVKGVAGNVIEDARVVAFTADGTIVSESNGTLGGGSESFYNNGIYYLLPEAEGDYTVRVEKAGISSEEFEVTLEKDECHVITQEFEIDLIDQSLGATVLEGEDVVGYGPVDSLLVPLERPAGSEQYTVIAQSQEVLSSEISNITYTVRILSSGEVVLNISDITFADGQTSGQINLQVEFAEDETQESLTNGIVGSYRLKVDKL